MFLHLVPSLAHYGFNVLGRDTPNCVVNDHFVYAASQWETTLHSNIVFDWLGAYKMIPGCD